MLLLIAWKSSSPHSNDHRACLRQLAGHCLISPGAETLPALLGATSLPRACSIIKHKIPVSSRQGLPLLWGAGGQ